MPYFDSPYGLVKIQKTNWRVFVLLFLFSSINDEILSSSNCFSSFNLSDKIGSIFASHSDSTSSEKWFSLSVIFFFVTSIQLVACAMRENLFNRFSGVQIACDICTRLERYLYSMECSWIIIVNNKTVARSDWLLKLRMSFSIKFLTPNITFLVLWLVHLTSVISLFFKSSYMEQWIAPTVAEVKKRLQISKRSGF